jgi:hypothetical protein
LICCIDLDIAASPHVTPAHSRQPSANPGIDIRSNSPALYNHGVSINQSSSSSHENTMPRPIPGMREQTRGMHGSPDSTIIPVEHRDTTMLPWVRSGQGMGASPAYSSSPPTWALYTRCSLNGTAENTTNDPISSGDIDETTMYAIDTAVCQAYAVFKFADRKLGQLLDMPSTTSQSSSVGGGGTSTETSTDNETGKMLASEALVLYLCALSSLQRGIDAARRYWEDIITSNNNNNNNNGKDGSRERHADRPAPQRLNDGK